MADKPAPTGVDQVRIGRATVSKWQIKVVLTVLGLVIMATVLFYTKTIVDDLVRIEKSTVQLYAGLLDQSARTSDDAELLHYLDIAYSSIYFPVIITDKTGTPIYPFDQFMMNVELDYEMTIEQQKAELMVLIEEMETEYKPYDITDPDGNVLQRVYFTNSAIVRRLRYMPFVEILIVTAFITIGYVAFSTIRRNEESNIWVGMSKEAAHQLGTPLSSLLAWLEILRTNQGDKELAERTVNEMEQDVERLKVIANRFSKIGSKPQRVDVSVGELIEKVCAYFDTRLPNLGRKVIITRDLDYAVKAKVSPDLFAWVLENLIKNAVEAIERKDGQIDIILTDRPKGGAMVIVTDNGKGVPPAERKRVFQPGYTTKRRGWGLGLSLSKRIVEDYHEGKLFIKDSQPGVGTTFQLEIP